MEKKRIITDIVTAIIRNGLDMECTTESLIDWYNYQLDEDHIVYLYAGDQLLGFFDWIRLPMVPADKKSAREMLEIHGYGGNQGYIVNAIILAGKGTLRKLIAMGKAKEPDYDTLTWNNNKTGKVRSFVNARRKNEEQLRRISV